MTIVAFHKRNNSQLRKEQQGIDSNKCCDQKLVYIPGNSLLFACEKGNVLKFDLTKSKAQVFSNEAASSS